MLRSLEIRNYRNLRHLTIEKLGRVNLLVGKNNTGKTSVLEAVAIHAEQGNELPTIRKLLRKRGEFYPDFEKLKSLPEQHFSSLRSLFIDQKVNFFEEQTDTSIYIGELKEIRPDLNRINIRVSRTYLASYSDKDGKEYNEYVIAQSPQQIEGHESRVEIFINRGIFYRHRFALSDELLFAEVYFAKENSSVFLQFVDAKNGLLETVQQLWNKVALTEAEDEILKALQVIEPRIKRFSLVGEGRTIIRLENGEIAPLASMGDGVGRIFTIILAMVNCENNGYFLIDEFENGLHYSVQEKLWEIIFYLAEKLNIQVFITTHSNDTIKAFGEVANSRPEYKDAQLIQLRNVKGEISAVLFGTEEVEIATETTYLDLR